MPTPRGDGRATSDMRHPTTADVPVSLRNVRIKLGTLVAVTAGAAVSGVSIWVTLALTLAGVAVPLAVAALGGAQLVRALFLIPQPVRMNTIRKDELT
jgi:hypothetical protein